MLSKNYLDKILPELEEVHDTATQVLEGDGYDGILEVLQNLRSVEFPAFVLEDKTSGAISLVEGPVDNYSQSIWVMCREGREDNGAEIYSKVLTICYRLLALLLKHFRDHDSELAGWNHNRIAYMRRRGGQDCRGWELVLSFSDDFSLLQ